MVRSGSGNKGVDALGRHVNMDQGDVHGETPVGSEGVPAVFCLDSAIMPLTPRDRSEFPAGATNRIPVLDEELPETVADCGDVVRIFLSRMIEEWPRVAVLLEGQPEFCRRIEQRIKACAARLLG